MRSLSPHPRDNSIRCLRVGSDDAVRKCVDHPAPVICHAVSHSHVTEITLFITSLVTLGRPAVNCYDRTWGALQPLHYPLPITPSLLTLGVFNSMFWPSVAQHPGHVYILCQTFVCSAHVSHAAPLISQ